MIVVIHFNTIIISFLIFHSGFNSCTLYILRMTVHQRHNVLSLSTYFQASFVLMKINHSFSFQIWKNEIFFHVCSTNGKQSSSYLQRTTLRKIKAEIAVKENFFQTWNSWNISNSVTSNLIFRRRVIMRTKIPNFLWYHLLPDIHYLYKHYRIKYSFKRFV